MNRQQQQGVRGEKRSNSPVTVQANFGRLFGPAHSRDNQYSRCSERMETLTSRDVLNLSHHQHTILSDHFSENDVLSIEERCRLGRNEELTAVRMRSRVGLNTQTKRLTRRILENGKMNRKTYHTQQTGLIMSQLEVLILEFRSIDTQRTSSIGVEEISTLNHEMRNHSVKHCALVPYRLSILFMFSSCKLSEVLCRSISCREGNVQFGDESED